MLRNCIIQTSGLTRLCFRSFSSKNVRVRFAPSPTGHLHLGGLRTALYNYLFCRSHNGKMILRIEDTDQTRKVDGAMEALIENLEWAGVLCDEGPTQGGNHGPYIQSERLHTYQDHVEKLLSNKSAYRCFCTERRLDILRRDALRNRQVPKYDNKCRHLTPEEIKEHLHKNTPYCVRFKLSPDISVFDDLVYGSIAYDVSQMEGDPIIMKSDGYPTYHLANVVDDHLMRVSHVLRGVEWQISTTKHLLMFKAFGWTAPQYGHLPLIMNADGSKLSKRQGDIRVQEYKNKGIFPDALMNYVTYAGGGFQRIPGEGVIVYSMEELTSQFRLDTVNSHSSRLNPDILTECNRLTIVEQLKDRDKRKLLVERAKQLIEEKFKDKNINCDSKHIEECLLWCSGRLTTLNDLVSDSLSFLWILPSKDFSVEHSNRELLLKLVDNLNNSKFKFESTTVKNVLKDFCKENNVKYSGFMKLLRNVLSGLHEGPGVADMMEILGRDNTLSRIELVLKKNSDKKVEKR